MWKNVHPVFGAGIRTHDLWNTSLFPLPLDQGHKTEVWKYRPIWQKKYFYLHFIFDKIKDHSVQYCDDIHSDTYEP